ncbi:arylamine N-acetyltransferase [Umezawaea sp. NPDC059074]|uniref:arylamine N-acetyltransferase family protein n=1 Tax=Umezawaea sp. NPDC059074 TaxID=3346716 RepID=UPI0036A1C358
MNTTLDPYLVSPAEANPGLDLHVDAYLARIGVERGESADLRLLESIVAGHARSIAFENLDSFVGRDVSVDDDALVAKLVHGRRGGFCFEQNMLLRGALDSLGYRTTALTGRVVWGRDEDQPLAPRTHMLVRVDLDEESYLVDVGFGGQSITGVLALRSGEEQKTPHEPFRILPVDTGGFLMQSLIGADWRSLYRFELEPQHRSDLEMGTWYVSRHPDSLFVNNLMAARADTDSRHTLRGVEAAVHRFGGPSTRRELDSASEVMATLEDVFLLDVGGLPDLERKIKATFF